MEQNNHITIFIASKNEFVMLRLMPNEALRFKLKKISYNIRFISLILV